MLSEAQQLVMVNYHGKLTGALFLYGTNSKGHVRDCCYFYFFVENSVGENSRLLVIYLQCFFLATIYTNWEAALYTTFLTRTWPNIVKEIKLAQSPFPIGAYLGPFWITSTVQLYK